MAHLGMIEGQRENRRAQLDFNQQGAPTKSAPPQQRLSGFEL